MATYNIRQNKKYSDFYFKNGEILNIGTLELGDKVNYNLVMHVNGEGKNPTKDG